MVAGMRFLRELGDNARLDPIFIYILVGKTSHTWVLVGSITTPVAAVTPDVFTKVWDDFHYHMDMSHVNIGHFVCKKTIFSHVF